MAYIILQDIEKYYGENQVLKKINLSIEEGEFVTLLGPSGCGKSTLLRCIAGLEQVSSGKIFLDGKEITHVDPRERNVGMIFQQYSLFPNLNVYKNIAFGLKMKKVDRDEIHERVQNAINMVDLKGKERKYPYQLSGGEQQRVALARCIVTRPKVLLLDEPLSAIDAKLRKSLQSRIKEIHKELGMTSIFVTHDQDEAMTMSDTIYLMKDGVIEQSGNPFELYSSPKSNFAASFIGNYNILSAKIFSDLIGEECPQVSNIVIRPELIEISSVDYEMDHEYYYFSGELVGILPQGNIIRYTVDLKEVKLDVDILNNGSDLYQLGQQVFLRVKRNSCISL
ncbi:ABC transporter ATP-binding protein [Tepidimicrobium xylanilyticum]|uniref:Putative spermidine/putrescine transport system ATP-binding protein n=1 Tax=Tepidimicrobium xylanilyticum TaxID=1123352 RepID=A0A1H2TE32_9FIRM|nr:ABC transporter ATP-binding protein [Tepidimicrobium xylanilyticum]GMG95965.1 ABC transporter ATP-binding protein [Tepidimicrobium xylanilyticum]SDW42223.1 putative spermidine/putrescine transport system ATP-binding protein [Tepidimicrobium xylanilyticum]